MYFPCQLSLIDHCIMSCPNQLRFFRFIQEPLRINTRHLQLHKPKDGRLIQLLERKILFENQNREVDHWMEDFTKL